MDFSGNAAAAAGVPLKSETQIAAAAASFDILEFI